MRRPLTRSLLLIPLSICSYSCLCLCPDLTAQQKGEETAKTDPLKEAVRKYEERLQKLETTLRERESATDRQATDRQTTAKLAKHAQAGQPTGQPAANGEPDVRQAPAQTTKLEAELRSTKRDLTAAVQASHTARRALRSSTDHTDQLAAELQAAQLRATSATKSKTEFASRANKLEVSLIQYRRQLADRQGALDTANQRSKSFEMALAQQQRDATARLATQHQRSKASQQAHGRREAELLELVEKAESTVKQSQQQFARVRGKLDQTTERVRLLESMVAAQKVENRRHQRKGAEMTELSSRLEVRATKLEAETKQLRAANRDLAARLQASNGQRVELEKDLAKTRGAKERAEDLAAQNHQLAAKQRAAHVHAAAQDTEISRLQAHIAALSSKHDKLSRDHAASRRTAELAATFADAQIDRAKAQAEQARETVPQATPQVPHDAGIRIYNQGGTVIIDRRQRITAGPATPRRRATATEIRGHGRRLTGSTRSGRPAAKRAAGKPAGKPTRKADRRPNPRRRINI